MAKGAYLVVAVLLMLGVYLLPTPTPLVSQGESVELTVQGKACLAVLAFAVVLWVSEALPFAITSLFVLLLIPAYGIADYPTAVRTGFGNPVITFFLGVLLLSAAFSRSGLAPGWRSTSSGVSARAPTGSCWDSSPSARRSRCGSRTWPSPRSCSRSASGSCETRS